MEEMQQKVEREQRMLSHRIREVCVWCMRVHISANPHYRRESNIKNSWRYSEKSLKC